MTLWYDKWSVKKLNISPKNQDLLLATFFYKSKQGEIMVKKSLKKSYY